MELTPSPLPIRMLTDDGRLLRCKIIPLAAWQMADVHGSSVAHGLGAKYLNIIGVDVFVRNDAGDQMHHLVRYNNTTDDGKQQGGLGTITDTFINFYILTGGWFDVPGFNGGGFSRGKCIIWYHE